MIQEVEIDGTLIKMWVDELKGYVWDEIHNLASLPFVFKHIALMPDTHAGKGMPIGSVLATKGVVIPNAVGVDIGCGMCVVKSSIRMEELTPEIVRKQIMRGIRKRIPLGREHHKQPQDESYMPQFDKIEHTLIAQRNYQSSLKQIGTLGGGNHFIELQRDTDGCLWVMIHSGSRHLGKEVCDYYNQKAEELNALFYSKVNPENQLAFLPMKTEIAKQYWTEMEYCIAFAYANRSLMIKRIEEVITDAFPTVSFEPMINIAHNYATWENHFGENVIVHRKGAVRAGAGEMGIIPGSQGTKSYIVRGLGNADSFCSSSHGAGRTMSRTEASHTLSLEEEQTRLERLGIIHTVRYKEDLAEATGAYKDIDAVMHNQRDLVEPVVELSPIAVIKG